MKAFDADFDYSKYNPDMVETQVESGGNLPAGYYHAKLNGANPTTSKKKGTACWELEFIVTAGPFAGWKMTENLWDSDNARIVNRILLFKHRLGLLKRTEDGKSFVRVEGKTDFRDCLDAPVIIHVVHELRKNEDGTPAMKNDGTQWVDVRLDFNGLFRPDDAKAMEKVGKPVEVAAGAATGTAGGGSAAALATPARPTVNTEDL